MLALVMVMGSSPLDLARIVPRPGFAGARSVSVLDRGPSGGVPVVVRWARVNSSWTL
jgi:hypothetical protein